MINSAAKEVLSKLGRIQEKNGIFKFENPYETALQAHRFEWTIRLEGVSLRHSFSPRIHGRMFITALGPEGRAQNTERPPLGSEPAGWAQNAVNLVEEIGGRKLLAPSSFAASLRELAALPDFLDNHAAQLMKEPWRSDKFAAGEFHPECLGVRIQASHSLGVVTPTEGCFGIEIKAVLSPDVDPLQVTVGGRVNISECAAFGMKLRVFMNACPPVVLACRVAEFKRLYPGKTPSDLDKEQEERVRKRVRFMIQKYGQLLKRWTGSTCDIWRKVRFASTYSQWKESIARSEMGEDVEIVSPPSYLDDAEFLGRGVLPQVEFDPLPPEETDEHQEKGGQNDD